MSLNLNIGIKITGFEAAFNNAVKKHFAAACIQAVPDINKEVQDLCERCIKSTPEYQSIVSGLLTRDLGLLNPVGRMDDIITVIKQNIQTKFSQNTLTVSLIRSGYKDILGVSAASYTSNRYNIPWLDWLLTRGDDVVVQEYNVKYGHFPQGRTGEALMFKVHGGAYRIPPQYSGISGDNFLTRALAGSEDEFVKIFETVIGQYLR